MIDYSDFLKRPKSLLIAPAGYGKSHTIITALQHCGEGRQLILTHTHAGIASLLEKIREAKISSKCYHIETISGFAQKYAFAFSQPSAIPNQQDENFYRWVLQRAQKLFKMKPVQSILRHTYTGLFVDEYQDCSTEQHALIGLLADLFPTRILGDHLQGIFNFKGQTLVDLDCAETMNGYLDVSFSLEIPQRWQRGNNAALGDDLKLIRALLLQKSPIALANFPSIIFHQAEERDLYDTRSAYYKQINQLLNEDSLLILHPETTSVNPRIALNKLFKNRLVMIESIDDKDFYGLAKTLDTLTSANVSKVVIEIAHKLFNKTAIDNWFNDKSIKNKIKPEEKAKAEPIKNLLAELSLQLSLPGVAKLLRMISNLPGVSCTRKEVLQCLIKSLLNAAGDDLSVYDAMVLVRNSIRQMGRKVKGKSFGTTLLTKGLEFDTVAILNAGKFTDPKHLYVALTRASRKLVIFNFSNVLTPAY